MPYPEMDLLAEIEANWYTYRIPNSGIKNFPPKNSWILAHWERQCIERVREIK